MLRVKSRVERDREKSKVPLNGVVVAVEGRDPKPGVSSTPPSTSTKT